jgi:hypothetical protein
VPSESDHVERAGETEQRFTVVVETLAGQPGVTPPQASGGREFGSSALKVHGSIFAMLTAGYLVVKLPKDRVSTLIEDGTGGPYDAGKGTPMKEWLTVTSQDEDMWMALAREALDFVRRRSRRR